MLSTSRLRILREVAYRGPFSAAAAALSYTQSAVSQQIAALEAEVGMALVERHPRGVSLTAAGHTLVAHAEGVLARLDAAEAALSAIAGLRRGSDADAAGDRDVPRLLSRRGAHARRGRTGGDRPPPARRRARSRAAVRLRPREPAAGGHDARAAARGPHVPGASPRAPARREAERPPR